MSGLFDERSDVSWPFITSGVRTSPWTRTLPFHGLLNRLPAARSSKFPTSAAYNTTTSVTQPDIALRPPRATTMFVICATSSTQ
jgi:hypothetical protein